MYYIGIDLGGTFTKAGIYTRQGEEVYVSSRSSEAVNSEPGWVERDMNRLWDSVCECIRDCLKLSRTSPSKIAGIGFSAHGKGLYPVDRQGQPVRNGIVSSDTRATALVSDWIGRGVDRKAYPAGRQQLWTGHPVALLAWMKKYEPENYLKTDCVFMAHDWVRFCLTGKRHAEITNISGSNAFNIAGNDYDAGLLGLFGLEDAINKFPPVAGSFEQTGRIHEMAASRCGLLAGTPVFGGLFDVVASAVSVGLVNEDDLNIVAGTWAIATRVMKKIKDDSYPYIWGRYCMDERYFVHEGSPTSASNLQWFIDNFMPDRKDRFQQCNRWVEELREHKSDLFFLPYLYGSNVSLNLKSAFFGLQAFHTQAHMVKAIYEGIVFSYLLHHEHLIRLQPEVQRIRFSGGPVHSDIWMQMFCDATGLPVEAVALEQSGCFAAALSAMVGAGEYSSAEQAVKLMRVPVKQYQPDPEQHRYLAQQSARYRCIVDGMSAITQSVANLG